MTTDPTIDSESTTDAELIEAVRGGDTSAYATLFERHRQAATRLANALAPSPDADDLVSEGFTRVYSQLLDGKGPQEAFRAYLLTAIRRLHIDRIRAGQRERPTEDEHLDRPAEFVDTAQLGFERTTTAEAFASLPERWQLVLWHLDVEGEKPADIAGLLGMSANSVSALAYRAREGLRQAYLQCHLTPATEKACADVTAKLGAHVRGGLSARQGAKVDAHLRDCHRCMGLYLELEEFNSGLGAILGPAVLGTAATGYLGAQMFAGVAGGAAGAPGGPGGGGAGGGGGGAAAGAVAAAAAGMVVAAGIAAVATGLVPIGRSSHTPSSQKPAAASAAPPASPTAPKSKAASKPSASTSAAPTTSAPTTAAPTTNAPSASPTTTAPTTSAPTTTAPTTTAPVAYDAGVRAVTFTNLKPVLTRSMAISVSVAGPKGASHRISVTIAFDNPVLVSTPSGWTSCSPGSGAITSLTCTLSTTATGTLTPSLQVTGIYPSGTVTLESAGDTDASDNQLPFTAGAWSQATAEPTPTASAPSAD